MNLFDKISDKISGNTIIYKNPTPIYHESLPLVILWSAKSGCSSVTKWFFSQLNILDSAYAYNKWIHHYRKDVFQKTPNYQKGLIAKLREKNVYVVKVVRNPFSRAVSSYFSVQTKYKKNRNFDKFQNRDRPNILEFLGRSESIKNSFSFREFVDFLKNGSYTNIHFIKQTHPSELIGKIKLDQILKLENLRDGITGIEKKLGLKEIDLNALFKSNHHVTYKDVKNEFCGDTLFPFDRPADFEIPKFTNFYDDQIKNDIYEIYKEDFTRYGYSNDL